MYECLSRVGKDSMKSSENEYNVQESCCVVVVSKTDKVVQRSRGGLDAGC